VQPTEARSHRSAEGVPTLAQVELFAGLPDEELAILAERARRRRYARGQIVFSQGDPGTSLCVVESGHVRMVVVTPDGKELVVNVLGPGDVFGELALLDGEPRSADAVAQEPCQLLHLQREDFVRFVETRPAVALRLLINLSRKLRRTTQQAQDVAFLDGPARLARALLELAAGSGEGHAAAQPVTPRLTQSDLAAQLGATRESVNKWLAGFERQGLVRREGGVIRILDPAGLRSRVY
jgi:CRP-like cAMP-binding protein